jgi:hypothetical protein
MHKDESPIGKVDRDKLANNQQGAKKTSENVQEARKAYEEAMKQSNEPKK